MSSFDFLSKIKSFFGKFKLSWKTMTAIVVILVLLLVAAYFLIPKSNSRNLGSIYNPQQQEGFEDKGKNAELILFYVDWCPHCKTAKPEWETTKKAFEGKQINGYKVVFTDINCTNETKEIEKMMSTYKIEGYPTIKMIKDGQVTDFDAKPTQSSLTKFINSAI